MSMRITNPFLERVLTATESDLVVAGQFMRVTGMVDPPTRLLRPSILLRVMRTRGRRPTDVRSVDEGFGGSVAAGRDEVASRSDGTRTDVTMTQVES